MARTRKSTRALRELDPTGFSVSAYRSMGGGRFLVQEDRRRKGYNGRSALMLSTRLRVVFDGAMPSSLFSN